MSVGTVNRWIGVASLKLSIVSRLRPVPGAGPGAGARQCHHLAQALDVG
ncbi:MAG: hypothetical protein WC058_11855 [Phycisphaeraceae bacterium]